MFLDLFYGLAVLGSLVDSSSWFGELILPMQNVVR
jgi:hypothetical protein